MAVKATLTKAESELVAKVRKGYHDAADAAELVALHALARKGHLTFKHDDDGFHFHAPAKRPSRKKG